MRNNTGIGIVKFPSLTHRTSAAIVLAMGAAILVSACGGGGGGSSTPSASPVATNSAISVSPSPLAFAAQTVVTPAAAQVITVKNTGNAALSVSAVAVTGTNAAAFAQTNTCASSVAVGSSCAITVTFTPIAAGAAAANITITSNAPTSPTTVAVSGALTVLNLATFQPASVAIGVPDLVTVGSGNATATAFFAGAGDPAVAPDGTFYLPDVNNRILGYHSVPVSNGASADFVLGQTSLTGSASGTAQGSLNNPGGVVVYNNHLLLADYGNNRVLIWNSLPTSTGVPPDVVVGQPDFTTGTAACTGTAMNSPTAVAIANGNLLVSDPGNNRVLVFNGIPTANDEAAVGVLGQPNFTTCTAPATITANSLSNPYDLFSDGTHLLVYDGSSRVLIWNTTDPTTLQANQAADMVLGASNFTTAGSGAATSTTFSGGNSLAYDPFSGRLGLADFTNNRVLIWNTVPTCTPTPCAITTPADVVLGQIDFTSNVVNAIPGTGLAGTAPSAPGLNGPFGSYFNGPNQLMIADNFNNRLLIYNAQ